MRSAHLPMSKRHPDRVHTLCLGYPASGGVAECNCRNTKKKDPQCGSVEERAAPQMAMRRR